MTKRIGFIGVGLMGHGMAKNLLEKGFAVTVMAHRNRKPVEDLLGRGASEATSAKELGQACDAVILCVTGAPQVEACVFGPNGLAAGWSEGKILIDCSTSLPATTERVSFEIRAKRGKFADAPLARTPVEAEQGRLNTMVGASDAVFTEIKPILEAFCENIFHVGDIGSGHKLKLANNFFAMGQAALIAEVLVTCKATGVDLRKFFEVVSVGAPNSGIFQMLVGKILEEGDFSGLKFNLANAKKDVSYFRQMVDEAGLAGPMAGAVHQAFVQGVNLGYGDGFVGDIVNANAKLNGIEAIAGPTKQAAE
ncbi:MAG: NAD(P)-dependent oxidoreductase [Alphaproteobacteria bacterium]|nr:NAD(P)-dependent oxidoreductase [Alphaproteobacteria bacterium]